MRHRPLHAIALCVASYGLFALQDAALKWLVADRSVFESLFWYCLAILVALLMRGGAPWREAWTSPARGLVAWRALVSLLAWLLYYSGGRSVTLAEMTTLYFSAPIIVTLLAVWLLGERTGPLQWFGILVGFAGVVVACRPERMEQPLAVAMILASSVLWAYGYILLRRCAGGMSLSAQVLLTNLVPALLLGVLLPWTWTAASPAEVAAMASVGLIGGLAQYLLYASFERAEASVLAPFEYSGLLWAFALSWLVWDARPDAALIAGAALMASSGLIGTWVASRRSVA
jgi:S-adenosylmethionine uptake transporter